LLNISFACIAVIQGKGIVLNSKIGSPSSINLYGLAYPVNASQLTVIGYQLAIGNYNLQA
jgi:hypothetical protein